MASEVVALLRNLMSSNSAWSEVVKDALMEGLDNLLVLVQKLNDSYETDKAEWFVLAQQVLATLCSLGGFKETIRPGCVAMVRVCGRPSSGFFVHQLRSRVALLSLGILWVALRSNAVVLYRTLHCRTALCCGFGLLLLCPPILC